MNSILSLNARSYYLNIHWLIELTSHREDGIKVIVLSKDYESFSG
jgi:hypothetical protein